VLVVNGEVSFAQGATIGTGANGSGSGRGSGGESRGGGGYRQI